MFSRAWHGALVVNGKKLKKKLTVNNLLEVRSQFMSTADSSSERRVLRDLY